MEGKSATKRHSPQEIVAKLRQMDALIGQGCPIGQAVSAIGVAEKTYFRWRAVYGRAPIAQAKRLRELEIDNARLRQAVSELTLDKLILTRTILGRLQA